MTALQGFVLGIIQGLTEFLPVSSSGHLVIGRTLFGLHTQPLPFEVAVHGATLLAVLFYFRRRVADMILGLEIGYMGKLVLATVPIVITATIFRGVVERAFETPLTVAVALAATGTVLLSLRLKARPDMRSVERPEPTWLAAWWVGCAQAAALMPGISRSGVTIVAALWLGVAPYAAAEFAFLLGVPAIAGAVVFETNAIQAAMDGGAAAYVSGTTAAFASALIAMTIVFRVIQNGRFDRFGIYCWVVAVAFGAYLLKVAS
ncbi:MAG: undecaprenyl-diphosphate phosphatase [Gemmatimonadota bacterium]